MIFQLIDNTSWASLLVNESRTWQRETRNIENAHNSISQIQCSKDYHRIMQVTNQGYGDNDV